MSTKFQTSSHGIDDRWSPTAPVVAFLDADCHPTFAPQPFLNNRRVQLITAASPEGATQPYMSQFAHDSLMLQLAAALWSPNELFSTGIFIHPRDMTYTRLKESTSYFGFNPRWCFKGSRSNTAMTHFKLKVEKNIPSIPPMVNILPILHETYTTSGPSHSIFELSPADDMRLLDGARVGAMSMWALDLLLNQYETRQSDAAAKFYHSIAGMRSAVSLRGRVMERQVLKYSDSLSPVDFRSSLSG